MVSKLVGKIEYYCRTTDVGMDCVKRIDYWCLQLCLYLLCLLESLDTFPMWKLLISHASHCWNFYILFLVCQQLQVAMSCRSQERLVTSQSFRNCFILECNWWKGHHLVDHLKERKILKVRDSPTSVFFFYFYEVINKVLSVTILHKGHACVLWFLH